MKEAGGGVGIAPAIPSKGRVISREDWRKVKIHAIDT
jgi:hypothetical protein